MIQYSLKCNHDHRFDSWFQSAEAFDKLQHTGMVTCAICGSSEVNKAIMAPRVRPARSAASPPSAANEPDLSPAATTPADASHSDAAPTVASPGAASPLSQPANPAQQAIAALKKQVEENSDYVGGKFVSEARAMHVGDAPERPIYGEANLQEAKELIEDGIPIAPLPFRPGRKSN